MLPNGTDLLYRRTLAVPHKAYTRIEVWNGTGTSLLEADLVYEDGDVTASLGSQVTRQLSLTVDEDLYPVNATDLLAPYGNRIRAYRGVQVGSDTSTYVWEVFHGRIQDAEDNGDGTVTVQASDRCQDVLDYGFVVPENSNVGSSVDQEVQRLIGDAVPDAVFGTFDVPYLTVPIETWENSRGGALDELAASVGAYWWALADGRYVLRRIPWTVNAPPVVQLTDAPGGIITVARPSRSRSRVYNSWSVTGERTDGTAPVYSLRQDLDPASPTFIDGAFGRRSNYAYLNTPSDFGAVDNVARTRLRSSVALSENWTYSCVPDASMELGDVQLLNVRERSVIQVVSAFRLPLNGGEMDVSTRSQVVEQFPEG